MHRIDHATRSVNENGSGKDGFTEGEVATQTPPTNLTAAIMNDVQEELCNTVENARITLAKGTQTQLRDAVEARIADHVALAAIKNHVSRTVPGTFEDIAFGNGIFLGIASDGSTWTSPDGETWSSATAALGGNVSFHGGLFFVAGANASFETSADGAAWTARAMDIDQDDPLDVVCYSGTRYVAGAPADDSGQDFVVQTSTDGATWTTATIAGGYGAAGADSFVDGVYDGSAFILVGTSGEIQTSADGTAFTARTPAASYSGNWKQVVAGGGYVLALGNGDNEIQYSADNGTTWAQGTLDATSEVVAAIAYDSQSERFFAVGSGGLIQSSYDGGATWETVSCKTSGDFDHVAFGARTALLLRSDNAVRQSLGY